MTIEVKNIVKKFGAFAALDNVDLKVGKGELLALLGPSGSGKTTLLRIIAGLDWPDAGEVRIDGEDALGHGASERHVGFVFQHYALFRHMTVFENVAFGLRVQPRAIRKDEATIRARVKELLDLVQLDWLANRYPSQLSGGQRQRIALARALAIEPRILLLDEPFGALDAKVRKELRQWLRSLHSEIHVTSIFVTHDQEEALEVANRVVVMDKGRIEQIGTPGDVYDNPATAFVHGFIGESIVLPVEVSGGSVRLGGRPLNIAADGAASGASKLFVRRHDMQIGPAGTGSLEGAVRHVRSFGPIQRAEVALDGRRGQDRDRDRRAAGPGTPGRRDRQPAAAPLSDFRGTGLIPSFPDGAQRNPGQFFEQTNFPGLRCAPSGSRPGMTPKSLPRSPFSHGWYATTATNSGGTISGHYSSLSRFWRSAAAWPTPRSRPADHVSEHGQWRCDAGFAGRRLHDLAIPAEQRPRRRSGRPRLMKLAEQQSEAMAKRNKLDHDVKGPLEKRLGASGYPAKLAVENVSAGYHTLAEAFSGWRDSPPHKANMLKNGVTKLGIAAIYAPNTKYKVFWTLILAST